MPVFGSDDVILMILSAPITEIIYLLGLFVCTKLQSSFFSTIEYTNLANCIRW